MRERRISLGLAPALPGIILVVVIVWALAAVLMLTGTLINAREIEDTVPIIVNEVQPINQDLDNIKRAEETVRLTNRIREAADPLSSQANRIIAEARSIDRSLGSILSTASAINDTATAINDKVLSINDTVDGISESVVAIHDSVESVGGSVASIGSSVSTIGGSVASIFAAVGAPDATGDGSISAEVSSILATFRRLAPEVTSIENGVQAINRRADAAIVGAREIEGDLSTVFELVGESTGEGHDVSGIGTIHGHANSIDCSPVLNLLGSTQYCGK